MPAMAAPLARRAPSARRTRSKPRGCRDRPEPAPGPGPERTRPRRGSVPRALLRKTELLDHQRPRPVLMRTHQLVDEDQATLPLVCGRANRTLVEEEEGTAEEEVQAAHWRPQPRVEHGYSLGFGPHQLLARTGGERDRLRPEPLVGDLALVAVDDESHPAPGKGSAMSDDGAAQTGHRGAVGSGLDLIGEERRHHVRAETGGDPREGGIALEPERNAPRLQAGPGVERAANLHLTLELGAGAPDARGDPHFEAVGVEEPDRFVEGELGRPEYDPRAVLGDEAAVADRVAGQPAPRSVEAEPADSRRLETERREESRVHRYLVGGPPWHRSTSRDGQEQLDGVGIGSRAGELVRRQQLAIQEDPVRGAKPAPAIEQHGVQRPVLVGQPGQRRLDGGRIHTDDPPVVGEAEESAVDVDDHGRMAGGSGIDSRAITS